MFVWFILMFTIFMLALAVPVAVFDGTPARWRLFGYMTIYSTVAAGIVTLVVWLLSR